MTQDQVEPVKPKWDEYKLLPGGRVDIAEETKMVRVRDLKSWDRDALPKDAKYFAKPGCKHCQGRGVVGRVAKGRNQVTCNCIMVLIKKVP